MKFIIKISCLIFIVISILVFVIYLPIHDSNKCYEAARIDFNMDDPVCEKGDRRGLFANDNFDCRCYNNLCKEKSCKPTPHNFDDDWVEFNYK